MHNLRNFILPLILLCLIGTSALTFPRLSVEHNAPCRSCHISPGGGGMRTEFANYAVGLNELSLPATKKIVAQSYKSPRISDGVTLGFDSRHLIFDDGTIFRMQTDIFANIELFSNFNYNIRFSESGIFENYALLYFNKQKHYIRFGRFTPTFGLKQSDHKSFNREKIGHGSLTYLDGVGGGVDLKSFLVNMELLNYGEQTLFISHISRNFSIDAFNLLAGASLQLPNEKENHYRFTDAKALFGGLSYNRFTLLGELDIVGKSNDTLISYVNFTSRLEYGLYFITEYNFFDGNRDIADGVEEYYRFSVELYPIPYFQLRPSYTYYTEGSLKDKSDFFLQVHVGY